MRCSLALRPPRLPHPSPLWQTGVGPKTAASLLRQHGSLEVILAAAPGGCKPRRAAEALASKAGSAAARLSRQLVEIRTDLDLPPLRSRPGDLELLASHFAERYARENERPVPELTPSFFAALARHGWPGNIRELENVMQRCVVLSQGQRLRASDLHWLLPPESLEGLPEDPPEAASPASWPPPVPALPAAAPPSGLPAGALVADPREPLVGVPLGTPVVLPLGLSLPDLERFWLLSTLSALKGNRTHAADQLGIALRTVRNKINEYRADGFEIPASLRGRDED